MWWIKSYMRRHRLGILLFLLFGAICAAVLFLYHLPMEAIGYAFALCLVIGVIAVLVDASAYRKKVQKLLEQQEAVKNGTEELPSATDSLEEAYQELIYLAQEERRERTAQLMREKKDITDYFTLWAHQIKTPIAVIRMTVSDDDTPEHRAVLGELFRIEQYVDMALCYVRLESSGNDLVIKHYSLDDIVKKSVRKFSTQFIGKKLSLDYKELDTDVLTDEKWLSFIIEQLLSNAIKYTAKGSVSIYMKPDTDRKILCIADTGIGIDPADLPRIFDNGYTGLNGRYDMKASGIGLYLCRCIADMLGITLTAVSELGKGSVFMLDLTESDVRHE